MSNKTYKLVEDKLIILENTGVKDYCIDYNIPLEEFNLSVVISPSISDCKYMFYKCNEFNQPVYIPSSVITCEGMFADCSKFNQSVYIPPTVTDCKYMFLGVLILIGL